MTAPGVPWQEGIITLPPGCGRQIRRRTIIGASSQIVVGLLLGRIALWIAEWQQIPDARAWVDPLWRVNITVGWLPAAVMIGAAVAALRVLSAVRGDSFSQHDAQRLVRNGQVWRIVVIALAVMLAIAQLIGCVVVFHEPGSNFAGSDVVQFAAPLLPVGISSILYLNVRYMLLRWPEELIQAWQNRRWS